MILTCIFEMGWKHQLDNHDSYVFKVLTDSGMMKYIWFVKPQTKSKNEPWYFIQQKPIKFEVRIWITCLFLKTVFVVIVHLDECVLLNL